jgi:Sporulation and spore germination/L,D-transpeptidase catalytic domain/Putative peptidoglycan binding domain
MLKRQIAIGLLFVVLALALAAQASTGRARSTVAVSFLRGEQLVKVQRPGQTPADAVRELTSGLTRTEARAGFRTYLPPSTRLRSLTVNNRLATINLSTAFGLGRDEPLLARVTQVVQTLTAFPTVTRVLFLVDGKRITRTVERVPLSRPLTLRYLQTPDVPVPKPPAFRLRPPDPATKQAQQQLITLGYLLPGDADGRYGPTTSEALLAFQKFQRLDRTSVLDSATQAALATATRPLPVTRAGAGKRAEVLLDRQVALLINNNRVVRTIAVSTGKPSTPTPPGSYRVYAKIPRWWSTPFREWLPWAIPFVGGIAFHEFPDVPAFPASHGCVRQSFAVARWTFNFAEVGMPVRVIARS